jgi:imidazolonepropionase-like amidohydrolase
VGLGETRVRLRRGHGLRPETIGAGAALRGRLWCGDGSEHDDGRVVVDGYGTVVAVGAATDVPVPYGSLEIEGGWVGPGLVDAHVHLAFGSPADMLAGGVVAVRDLGAPLEEAVRWRALEAPRVHVSGPLLTAPGGYPSQSWGQDGFALFVDGVEHAHGLVTGLAGVVDVVKLTLEPAGGPVLDAGVATAVVEAAHAAQVEVTCHALSVEMVERALDAGVDELAHTPTEPLPAEVVSRIATAGVRVVSTLHTFVSTDAGGSAVGNAAALAAAGVELRYGTDLGNAGIRPGADVEELALLADRVGLGPEATLLASTEPVEVGQPAGLCVLDHDPRQQPDAWRRPHAVVVGPTLLLAE